MPNIRIFKDTMNLLSHLKRHLYEIIAIFISIIGLIGLQNINVRLVSINNTLRCILIGGVSLFLVLINFYVFLIRGNTIKIVPFKGGLNAFKQDLSRFSKTGGTIFTTALFEDYHNGDLVIKELEKFEFKKELRFERFVFLGDPSYENLWIKNFLAIKKNNLKTIIYQVKSQKKVFNRVITKAVPRFSLTQYIYTSKLTDTETIKKTYIGLIGGSSEFGFYIKKRKLNNMINKYIEHFKREAITLTNPNTIPNLLPLEERLIDSIICDIEELPKTLEYIKYIGIFGSRGLILNNKIGKDETHKSQGDIDFLIVVASKSYFTDIQTIVNTKINEYNQKYNEKKIKVSLEWSNLDKKYYVHRAPIHIDIQLHFVGDQHYISNPLLGYSVFDSSLFTVYSSDRRSVQQQIPYPTELMNNDSRESLVLEAEEYGLSTAILRICDITNYGDTDEYRLLWISILNYIWAKTGMFERRKKIALEYIKQELNGKLSSIEFNIINSCFNGRKADVEITKDRIKKILIKLKKDLLT